MAASVGRRGAIRGINITPLVDIFLVLLILVMISSTLAAPEAIEVLVPKAASAQAVAPASSSGLVLHGDGTMLLDGNVVTAELAGSRLKEKVRADSGHSVLLSADGRLPYEEVARILDIVKGAGVSKFALRMRKGE